MSDTDRHCLTRTQIGIVQREPHMNKIQSHSRTIIALLLSAVTLCVTQRPVNAQDKVVIVGLVLVVFLPYLVGINAARLFWRSRVRFFRSYQHQ